DPSLAWPLEWMRDVRFEDRVPEHVPPGREPGADHRGPIPGVRRIARRQRRRRIAVPRDTRVDERSERHREEGHVEEPVLRHPEYGNANLEAGDGELAAEQPVERGARGDAGRRVALRLAERSDAVAAHDRFLTEEERPERGRVVGALAVAAVVQPADGEGDRPHE